MSAKHLQRTYAPIGPIGWLIPNRGERLRRSVSGSRDKNDGALCGKRSTGLGIIQKESPIAPDFRCALALEIHPDGEEVGAKGAARRRPVV